MSLSNYRDRPHWSYSSLNQVLNICSLQYYFEKIEKIPRPFAPVALVFGSAFHRVMEYIALNRMDGKLPKATETRDLFHTLWEREHQDSPPLEQMDEDPTQLAEQGAGLIEAYLNQINPDERIVDVNTTFAVPIGDSHRPLIGEIDCITESHGDVELVDWKTSARRWPKDQADKSLQPTVYLYAMSLLQPGFIEKFRFDVAVKNKTPVIERNYTTRQPDDFVRLERLVEKAEAIIEHDLFYPSDQSFACNGCQFKEPCRAWHRQQARTTVTLAA